MESSLDNEQYNITLDSVDEFSEVAWFSLIQNLSPEQLNKFENIFKENAENALDRQEFLDAVCFLYENSMYSVQSLILYENINKENKSKITWNDFLDYLIENLNPKSDTKFELSLHNIEAIPQTKRETIVKIVLIETEKFFCYAILSKHGKIGLYDGNMNFLTSYLAIMTREDISRNEEERRRRNRWLTDAIFCQDVLLFIVANSTRSIMIYEASGLNHVPLWLLLTAPYIIECMAYKPYIKNCEKNSKSVLFLGMSNGEILTFNFQQPKSGLLRKKQNDKMTLYYWIELADEKDFIIIKSLGKHHKEPIKNLQYFEDNGTLLSCSRDPNSSVLKQFFEQKSNSYRFKMYRGATTFSLSRKYKVVITGSDDGIIRIWNSVIVSKPISVLTGHESGIVDIQIMENLELFLSISRDGVFKLWELKDNKCINTIHIKFPSFKIEGKLIEWGLHSIYPGPKRIILESDEFENSYSGLDISDTKRKHEFEDNNKEISDIWERSHILITCCNYIAKFNVTFKDARIEESFQCPVLPPPPLQNSVLIPANWKLCQSVSKTSKEEHAEFKLNELDEEIKYVLNKDFLTNGTENEINYHIASLERKKVEMQKHVEKGAPYLALDLYDLEEINISEHLVLPSNQRMRDYVEKTKNLLVEAGIKDKIFSEPPSTRTKSSRSSIVEFPL